MPAGCATPAKGAATSLHNLGILARKQGDLAAARTCLEESLAARRELGDMPGIAEGLEECGHLAAREGEPARAARLLGTAEALREEMGAPLAPAERADHERGVAAVRAALGEAAFAASWAQGRGTSPEQAVVLALAGSGA